MSSIQSRRQPSRREAPNEARHSRADSEHRDDDLDLPGRARVRNDSLGSLAHAKHAGPGAGVLECLSATTGGNRTGLAIGHRHGRSGALLGHL